MNAAQSEAQTHSPESEPSAAATPLTEEDPLAIRSFVIGDYAAQVEAVEENGETVYQIHVALPLDTEFNRVTVNLELASGASISEESNCIVADLAGRPVINMTVENAVLVIENDGKTREYSFRIDLL